MNTNTSELKQLSNAVGDLTQLVVGGFETMNTRFDHLEGRMDRMEGSMDRLERIQSELRDWIEKLDGRLMGVENDIKEIYKILTELMAKQQLNAEELMTVQQQMQRMAEWMQAVSKKTGVPMPKL